MPEILGEQFNIEPGQMYQPIHGHEELGGRECKSRLEIILEADRVFDGGRIKGAAIADIGPNLGWFLFEMEKRGLGVHWVGIERDMELVRAATHIGKERESKAAFFGGLSAEGLPSEVVLMLSVTHHLDMGDWFKKLALNENVKTIYIEQATHMEPAGWAKNMIPDKWSVPAFYWREKFEQMTGSKFVARIVGATRSHLNTVRYFYQLKRKLEKEVELPGGRKIQVIDEWGIPYLNGVADPEAGRYYARESGGCFYKLKQGNVYWQAWVDGVLLVDAFRWGLIPFFDRKILKDGLRRAIEFGGSDLRPHNLMVDQYGEIHRIDLDDVSVEGKADTEAIRHEFNFFLNLI